MILLNTKKILLRKYDKSLNTLLLLLNHEQMLYKFFFDYY